MTSRRLRTVGGPVLLTLAGVAAVAGSMPRVALSGTLPACITESAGSAWLGIHLSLLSQSPLCPEGSFAAGPHYAEVARFSVVLSLSALIAGLVTLLGALGFGVWARVALQRARTWLHHRFELPVATTAPVADLRPPLAISLASFHSALSVSPRLLRGPPVPVAA